MEQSLYDAYLEILKEELVPAMGCTEPIAVAYAAALAARALGCPAEALSVSVEDVAPEDWNRDVGEKIPEDKIYSGEMYKVK